MEVIPIVLGGIASLYAIVAGSVKGGRFLREKARSRAAAKRELSSPEEELPFPVRFTCREDLEFHPEHGYREGLVFEVFNTSDKPVVVKGFGLDLTMRTQDEWHEYHQATQHPAYDFPYRLPPNEALDGVIDTEALADDVYARGYDGPWTATSPFVNLAGYGVGTTEIEKR